MKTPPPTRLLLALLASALPVHGMVTVIDDDMSAPNYSSFFDTLGGPDDSRFGEEITLGFDGNPDEYLQLAHYHQSDGDPNVGL